MEKLSYIIANLLRKNPPKHFLKSNYTGRTRIISFHHKDAIGKNKKNAMIGDENSSQKQIL